MMTVVVMMTTSTVMIAVNDGDTRTMRKRHNNVYFEWKKEYGQPAAPEKLLWIKRGLSGYIAIRNREPKWALQAVHRDLVLSSELIM